MLDAENFPKELTCVSPDQCRAYFLNLSSLGATKFVLSDGFWTLLLKNVYLEDHFNGDIDVTKHYELMSSYTAYKGVVLKCSSFCQAVANKICGVGVPQKGAKEVQFTLSFKDSTVVAASVDFKKNETFNNPGVHIATGGVMRVTAFPGSGTIKFCGYGSCEERDVYPQENIEDIQYSDCADFQDTDLQSSLSRVAFLDSIISRMGDNGFKTLADFRELLCDDVYADDDLEKLYLEVGKCHFTSSWGGGPALLYKKVHGVLLTKINKVFERDVAPPPLPVGFGRHHSAANVF